MIDRDHSLSITKQAGLLGMSRSSVYYLPRPSSAADLALMRVMDELHLEFPFMGARQLSRHLLKLGHKAGRLHVRTLMTQMGIEALAPQPGTSERNLQHKVLAHRVAITMEALHAKEVLQEALNRYGVPEIVNTGQGSQFTAQEFVDTVLKAGAKLSMDGRGAWRDNVFVERVWRSVKYECVYLKAYESVSQARADITRYINWYNAERCHSSHGGQTPDEVWTAGLPQLQEAA